MEAVDEGDLVKPEFLCLIERAIKRCQASHIHGGKTLRLDLEQCEVGIHSAIQEVFQWYACPIDHISNSKVHHHDIICRGFNLARCHKSVDNIAQHIHVIEAFGLPEVLAGNRVREQSQYVVLQRFLASVPKEANEY